MEELPEYIDAVVISHTHYDHMNGDTVSKLHERYVKLSDNRVILKRA